MKTWTPGAPFGDLSTRKVWLLWRKCPFREAGWNSWGKSEEEVREEE
jgi:hypothetical protein